MLNIEEKTAYCGRHGYSRPYLAYWIAHPGCECNCAAPSEPPHHIRTRGAGGTDEEWNLLALCVLHHRTIHHKGVESFARLFPVVEKKIHAALDRPKKMR
jgi:hypothetical protein